MDGMVPTGIPSWVVWLEWLDAMTWRGLPRPFDRLLYLSRASLRVIYFACMICSVIWDLEEPDVVSGCLGIISYPVFGVARLINDKVSSFIPYLGIRGGLVAAWCS